MDFTLIIYKQLLIKLKKQNLSFLTFREFIEERRKRGVILRHDVDDQKLNSLQFAKIQHELGIKGTYYFRIVPESYDEKVITEIANMGHEIGYHYEDMDLVHKANPKIKNKEKLIDLAIESFSFHLEKLRKLVPVKTICMHGSPLSKFDNKSIWEKFHYHDFGIIGEPYFDLDFDEVLYMTDTGRRWNGSNVSVRDKVESQYAYNFKKTSEIIKAVEEDKLPDQIMFTFHPERWSDKYIPWIKELVIQNSKNILKKYYFVIKNKSQEVY